MGDVYDYWATSMAQLKEDIEAFDKPLSEEALATLLPSLNVTAPF